MATLCGRRLLVNLDLISREPSTMAMMVVLLRLPVGGAR